MKRIISLLAVFAIILSFAACKSETDAVESTTILPPVISESYFSEEFKDSSGKTVIIVEVTLPQITEYAYKNIKDYLNDDAMKLFENACDFAESNVENASNFMKNQNSDKPWKKKIVFETSYLGTDYACFIIKDYLSYYNSEVIPSWDSLCYNVVTGARCSLADFSVYYDNPQAGFEAFMNDVVKPNIINKFDFPQFLDEDVLETLDELVLNTDFYLTEKGISFYIDGLKISPSLAGTSSIDFTWEELNGYYEPPLQE